MQYKRHDNGAIEPADGMVIDSAGYAWTVEEVREGKIPADRAIIGVIINGELKHPVWNKDDGHHKG